jgi:hypothetical protein
VWPEIVILIYSTWQMLQAMNQIMMALEWGFQFGECDSIHCQWRRLIQSPVRNNDEHSFGCEEYFYWGQHRSMLQVVQVHNLIWWLFEISECFNKISPFIM